MQVMVVLTIMHLSVSVMYDEVITCLQKGIAERAIRDVQEQTRKSLLHAINH